MKVQVQHIYDSTMADKNAIVSNALQFNIIAETETESPPQELAITYDCYYDNVLFYSSSKLPLIYYFNKANWIKKLTQNDNGYYYFDPSKIKIKWIENNKLFETNTNIGDSLKIVAWSSSFILYQGEGELERPATEDDLGKQYQLSMSAINLTISSDNELHSDWTPKLINYHFWLNKSTTNYIDIPIAPLIFPDELVTFNENQEINNYDFNLKLWIKNNNKTFEIFALTSKLKQIEGRYFLKEQNGDNFKVSYKQATPDDKITATHILIPEKSFSDAIAGTNQIEDENNYHLFLTINCNPKNGAVEVQGIKSFKYLTVINLIYKEAPFFNLLTLPADKITWTLDKYHLDLFPWQALVDEAKITNMWYNAGSTLKFNLSENQPQLCGRQLVSYILYESENNSNYNRVIELTDGTINDVAYTILRRGQQAENIRYGLGIKTTYNDEILETPLNSILKIDHSFRIGRVVNPVVTIANCLTVEGRIQPQLKIDDYGGNNKQDFNLLLFSSLASLWRQEANAVCQIQIQRSFNKDFLNSTINKIIIQKQDYSKIDWLNLDFSASPIILSDLEKTSTIYIKAKISFVYGCQDNIDLISCETPIYTYLGLEKLPTVSYLKNQIGINTPGLAENELIGITADAKKALIRLLNSSRQYASVNVNTRNLNEFIINCGSWDDAEFGYSNFMIQDNTIYVRQSISVSALTKEDWTSKKLYAQSNSYNVRTGKLVSTQYYCINGKSKEWSEKAEICRNLTTLYYYTDIAYLQYQDNAKEKFTVEE